MSQNLQLMREVITDMGQEVDASFVEINKLKLDKQRVDQSIEEMKQKFNFIQAKMETKLFAAIPDAPKAAPAILTSIES